MTLMSVCRRAPVLGIVGRIALTGQDLGDIAELDAARGLRGGQPVDENALAVEVEAAIAGDGPRALEAHVHLVDPAFAEDSHDLGNVALAAAIRVDPRVGGVARQLEQKRPGREPHLRERAAVEARVAAIGQQHDCRRLSFEGEQPIGAVPALDVVAAAMRIARLDQPSEQAALAHAQRVAPARLGEVAVAELAAVEVDDRVAGHHQGIGLRHVLERERLEHIVALNEGDSGRTVVQAVVRHVERGVLDGLPRADGRRALQILLQREVELEIERVAVAADPARVGMVDVLAHMRQQHRGVRVVDLAVGEDVLLAAVEQPAGVGPIDGAVDEVEHESLDVLGGVDAQPVDPHHLDQPLRVAHQIAGGVLDHRIALRRILQVERVDRDVRLPGLGIEYEDGAVTPIRIEAAVGRIGDVGEAPERGGLARADVARIGRVDGTADEPVILLVGDVDQASQPLVLIAPRESGVKIAVDVVRQRDREPGIAAGGNESQACPGWSSRCGSSRNRRAGRCPHGAGLSQRAQPGFRPVQRRPVRPPQIEAIVHVVAHALVAGVGTERRRQPHEAIARHEQICSTLLHCAIRRLEPLQDGRRRDVDGCRRHARGQQQCRNEQSDHRRARDANHGPSLGNS